MPGYRREMTAGAKRIGAKAGPMAPRKTGYYSRRFEVGEDHGEVVLMNTDPFAHLIEFGSANSPPYAVIRRAVRAAGYFLAEDPAI